MDEQRSGCACLKMAQQFHRAARLLDVAAEGACVEFVNVPAAFNHVRTLDLAFRALLLEKAPEHGGIHARDLGTLYAGLPQAFQSLLQFQLSRSGRFDMFADTDALGGILSAIAEKCLSFEGFDRRAESLSPAEIDLLNAVSSIALRLICQELEADAT